MIQPLGSSRTTWLVHWVDLDQPLPSGKEVILPTLVIVCDSSGTPLAPPAMLEELDQLRVENLLLRLFDQHGPPDILCIAESADWDTEAWKGFSEEHRLEIRFQSMSVGGVQEVKSLARSVVEKFSTGTEPPDNVAMALVASALRVRSQSKKEALLRLAVEQDSDCAPARIELADLEFQRGNWKACMAAFNEVAHREERRLAGTSPDWWQDTDTRPYLRALYGRAMTHWHRGRYSESARELSRLLALNPSDNQGVRFFIPLLHLLSEDLPSATAAFRSYAEDYPDDYPEPAMLFGWALCSSLEGDETTARTKYREGILRNLYIAPMLMEENPPNRSLWLPNDRADPNYASEFVDSYAVLWDRESGALRLLREVWDDLQPTILRLIEHRENMLDFQDQRYEPRFKQLWQEFLDEDEKLSSP